MEATAELTALGYIGVRSTRLDDWGAFATRLLGMQQVDCAGAVRAFRMDDRKQRLIVTHWSAAAELTAACSFDPERGDRCSLGNSPSIIDRRSPARWPSATSSLSLPDRTRVVASMSAGKIGADPNSPRIIYPKRLISTSAVAWRRTDALRFCLPGDEGEGLGFLGWEIADAAALDALSARLDAHGVKVRRASRALADERHVADLIVFQDPAGNRLEVFHGPAIAGDPFRPGRPISGFRTGPLGMGYAVLNVKDPGPPLSFYRDLLGFRVSDYSLTPYKLYFFHINGRHHSFAA